MGNILVKGFSLMFAIVGLSMTYVGINNFVGNNDAE